MTNRGANAPSFITFRHGLTRFKHQLLQNSDVMGITIVAVTIAINMETAPPATNGISFGNWLAMLVFNSEKRRLPVQPNARWS